MKKWMVTFDAPEVTALLIHEYVMSMVITENVNLKLIGE